MKLSWKLFFVTTPVMILVLTVFGMWMVQATFTDALERETEQCRLENQYAATSYILTRRAFEETSPGRYTESEVVAGFHEAESEKEGCLRIYGEDGQILYEDNGLSVEHGVREAISGAANFGYEICRVGSEYYVAAVSVTEGDVAVEIETVRRITDIFADRDRMNETYRYGLLAASLCVGLILWLTLYLSLRRTSKLSQASKELSAGNLTVRARVEGQDEISELASEFNAMADTIEEQMLRLKDEALRQEQFTSAFAHELKTPLTSIIGYSEMLATMDLSEEESRMCADYINSQSKRLKTLSYKLLDMALLRKKNLEKKPVRCRWLADQVEATEKLLVEKRGMIWHMDVEDGQIQGDSDLLQSLLMNLIDNSVKASSPGGMIVLAGRPEKSGYVFLVMDQGTGVAREELPRLTEAFYMVDKSRSRKEGGAGLGLTLCRQIAQLHGASMKFDSDTGKGMRIWIRFPKEGKSPAKKTQGAKSGKTAV